MKFLIKTVVLLALTFALFVPAMSQAAPALSIATVDVQSLIAQSKAGNSLQQQIEKRKNEFLGQIADQEKKLRDEEKTLSDQRTNPPTKEFIDKAKNFEGKLNDSRRDAQEKKKNLEMAAAKALEKLRTEITKVVQQIASEKSYTMVLNRQDVIISDNSYDITSEALEKLDKSLPTLTLDAASN